MYRALSFLAVCFLAKGSCERHLPKNFPRCARDDPHLNQCMLKATDTVRPLIVGGSPAINMPPLEPFVLEKLTLEQGTSSMNIKSALTDVRLHGLSKYKYTKYNVQLDKNFFECELYIPGIELDGYYKVDGQILVLPIHGEGRFNASISRIDVWFYQEGITHEKNGKHYFEPTNTNSTIKVSDPKLYLDGLFGNNEELSKLTMKAINDNINLLYEDMRPVMEKVINDFVQNAITVVTEEIPQEELYPPMKSLS